jgi:hypothetical protein
MAMVRPSMLARSAVALARGGMENRTKLRSSTAATAETGREAVVDVPIGVRAWFSTWSFTR